MQDILVRSIKTFIGLRKYICIAIAYEAIRALHVIYPLKESIEAADECVKRMIVSSSSIVRFGALRCLCAIASANPRYLIFIIFLRFIICHSTLCRATLQYQHWIEDLLVYEDISVLILSVCTGADENCFP